MSKDANNRRHKIRELLKFRTEDSAISAREIHQELCTRGFDYTKKTIERDLKKLSQSYGLCSTGSNPERFYAPGDFNFSQEVTLDFFSLETLYIALQNLKETSHEYFSDQIGECEAVLMGALNKELVGELEYSRDKYHFDYGLAGKPVDANRPDIQNIFIALREEREIQCLNISPYKEEEYNKKVRRLAPLNFILSAGMPYLIAKDLNDQSSPSKRFRLTRLKNVELGDVFDIQEFDIDYDRKNALGGWGNKEEKLIEVKIHADSKIGTYFSEKKLHPSQKVEKLNDDEFLISLKVPHSSELAEKLAGFGGSIYHISPRPLFENVISIWESGLRSLKKMAS